MEDSLPQRKCATAAFRRDIHGNGYYDMSKIMEALVEVRYDGIVILDHTPELTGGHYAEQAYGFAYMKALKSRAEARA